MNIFIPGEDMQLICAVLLFLVFSVPFFLFVLAIFFLAMDSQQGMISSPLSHWAVHK